MNARSKIHASVFLAALATAAAPAVAAESVEISTAPIVSGYYYVPPDGRYYYVPATEEVYVTPVTRVTTVYEPPITVYGERLTEDQLITRDVVNEIAGDPRISGYVGVETNRSEVTLNGLVTTPGQADRAARNARRVEGVRDVHNNLRARVGG